MRNIRKAFTLVELLVVLVVISLLAMLLFGVFSRVREQGRKAVCINNVRQFGAAFLQYTQDNGDRLPLGHSLQPIQVYIRNTGILSCPSDIGDQGPNPTPLYQRSGQGGSSYFFNAGVTEGVIGFCELPENRNSPPGIVGLHLGQIRSPSRVVLVSEKTARWPLSWHDGVFHGRTKDSRNNVCFVDGHVKFIKIFKDETNFPELTDYAACYDPPGTKDQTSSYEYQWSAAP